MTDNDEDNVSPKKAARKKCLLKKIFGWACLTIFLLLIVGMIVLRAPWKVTGLLIIIPITFIIIQKLLEKWMWTVVAIYLTALVILTPLVIWVFLPDGNEGWRPYTFDKELAEMEAKRFVSAEDNAATIYKQLLENQDPNYYSKDFLSWENKDLILSDLWESKDYPEVASWLEDGQQIIDQLMLACEKDKCRFPIAGNLNAIGLKPLCNFKEVTGFWWSSGKRLAPMRHWSELLIVSANNDVAEGRVDEGLEKYIATLQMSKHLYQQPTPMDLLVGIAIKLRGLDQINKYVVTNNATDEQLQLLDNVLKSIEYDWRSDMHQILDREKLMFKSFMCAMFYQTNAEGRIRLNRDPNSALSDQIHICPTLSGDLRVKFTKIGNSNYWRRKLTKTRALFCWFFVPSTPQKAEMIIDDVHKQYYAMAESKFDWEKEPKQFSTMTVRLNFRWLLEMMSRIMEDNWPKINDIYLRATVWKRASRHIIALRRYKNRTGHWPEKLEEIKPLAPAEIFVDPINNSSFVYKLTEKNFVLYSKGKNSIDEDGKRDDSGAYIRIRPSLSSSSRDKKIEPDDRLIWPPEKRKAQSVKEAKKKIHNE